MESKETLEERRRPVHMIYVNHHQNTTHHIYPMIEALTEALEKHPEGKAAVFLEDGYMSKRRSDRITRLITGKKMSPLEAYYLANIEEQLDEKYPQMNDELRKKNILENMERFQKGNQESFYLNKLKILNDVYEKYNGRITLIFENNPHQIHEKVKTTKTLEDAAFDLGIKGMFREGVSVFKKFITDEAKYVINARDERISEILGEYFNKEEYVARMVMIGAVHTSLGKRLRDSGFKTRDIYPGKYNGICSYEPSRVLIRKVVFHPNQEISDDEYMVFYQKSILFRGLRRKTNWDEEVDRKRGMLFAGLNLLTKNLKAEDADIFSLLIRENGFEEGVDKMVEILKERNKEGKRKSLSKLKAPSSVS